VTMTVAADGSVTGTWTYRSREVTDESMDVSGVSARYHAVRTWAMTTGTVGGSVCDLQLTSGTLTRLSCVGACGSDPEPAAQGGTLDFGAPRSTTSGDVTWQWTGNAADGHYTDTFTITVTGPR